MAAKRLLYFIALLCLAGTTASTLQGQGLPGNGCSVSNLNGKYVIGGQGSNVQLDLLGLIELQQHVEDLGFLVFDGNGNVSQGKMDETVDTTFTDSSVSGTYTISASCIGALTLNVNGATRHYGFLPFNTPGGMDRFSFIENDATSDITLTGQRTFDPAGGCSANILPGQGFYGEGHGGAANTDVSEIAEVAFNQDGTFNLKANGSANGGMFSQQVSGTYAVATDCSVALFQNGSNGPTQVGQLQLEIPQPAASTDLIQAAAPVSDSCPGCKVRGELELTSTFPVELPESLVQPANFF